MEILLVKFQEYIPGHVLLTLTLVSAIGFLGSLIAIPFILVRLPADYFDVRYPRSWMAHHHPVLRFIGHLLKNVLGAVLLLAGLAMLFLPGQGVLTMLIGVTLLDFPGKRRLERKLIGHPTVLQAINAMRQKFGKPPLVLGAEPASGDA